ncbi:MAG: hypothetical protein CMI02_19250 [Oceanospirillaceae bacterium]|nr:hypothetical protein [Oceanospirillaceae bacterium]MBT14166.1 hypothetical protein [Oceanospirillaceae bacterium]|tara:strand:+ start:18053 stop:19282 length:1230 start_codon:yes stop_codon:yes gene_type:complete
MTLASDVSLSRTRRTLRILWHTIKRFESEARRRDAAALTYTTLFALVPVITVIYAILSAIPSLQSWGGQVNDQLLGYLMPQGSDTVSDYLKQFSQQARKLTWIGVVFLFITAFMLLRTIEMQFNKIWNVEKSRSGLQTFLRYWAVLSLGPLLFGAAMAASSLIASLPLWSSLGQVPALMLMVPWLLSSSAITALYMLVPNCHVPWRHAALAGVLVGGVFELGKFLFAKVVGLFPSYQLIYGAFAAVPLFLTWMYISWMLILLGAELSFSLSHSSLQQPRKLPPLWLRLRLYSVLWQRQQVAEMNDEGSLAAVITDLRPDEINAQLAVGQRQGWLSLSQDQQWLWLKDIHTMTMGELIADLPVKELTQAVPDELQPEPSQRTAWTQWQQNWNQHLDTPVSELMAPAGADT